MLPAFSDEETELSEGNNGPRYTQVAKPEFNVSILMSPDHFTEILS